ncbi:hypothetical protein AYM39_09760 [Methylomonas sp. DH-1]|nr:hypothetical protein AYM39_09760 [Methylomonas sp. DH-1]
MAGGPVNPDRIRTRETTKIVYPLAEQCARANKRFVRTPWPCAVRLARADTGGGTTGGGRQKLSRAACNL